MTALGEMRVTDRHRERVRRIRGVKNRFRQQLRHHDLDLVLVGVTGPNHGFLHPVWRIFRHPQSLLGRRQQNGAPGQTELQGRFRVLVHESLLDRCLTGAVAAENFQNTVMQFKKAFRDGAG